MNLDERVVAVLAANDAAGKALPSEEANAAPFDKATIECFTPMATAGIDSDVDDVFVSVTSEPFHFGSLEIAIRTTAAGGSEVDALNRLHRMVAATALLIQPKILTSGNVVVRRVDEGPNIEYELDTEGSREYLAVLSWESILVGIDTPFTGLKDEV